MYQNGRGVPQNDAEAVKWYRLAAEQGNAFGQKYLGAMYQNGRGVPQNDVDAVKWYRLAAEQGNVGAQASLDRMYGPRGAPQAPGPIPADADSSSRPHHTFSAQTHLAALRGLGCGGIGYRSHLHDWQ